MSDGLCAYGKENGVEHRSMLKRNWVRGSAFIATAALSLVLAAPAQAAPLKGVESASVNADKEYVVDVVFADGIKGKITFLDEDIFRYNVDPANEFSEYAKPRSQSHVGRIPAQPDSSNRYKHTKPQVTSDDATITITAGKTTISLDKATAKMTVKSGDKVLIEEKSALDVGDATVQTLTKGDGEHFFGGGTQNGRIDHTGKVITMDKGGWEDGQNASPAPFYWSTKGYGVLRNTFQNGAYDFGKTDSATVSTSQEEKEFDAYYFLSEDAGTSAVAQDILGDYFEVTGNPVLLPEYAFYLGHLNAYNRDGWSTTDPVVKPDASTGKTPGKKAWETKGSKPATESGDVKYEVGMDQGYLMQEQLSHESLNGEGPTIFKDKATSKDFPEEFSARHVLDEYQDADMPFGWFLPNDGYGAGYGQNGYWMTGMGDSDGNGKQDRIEALDANVENLKKFTEYANERGVATGLWTQSDLTPDNNANTPWHRLRDFGKEVEVGGVSSLKTDVAWVGAGYSMALDGTVNAYNTATTRGDVRPNLVTLCGWAGTQRTGAIWSGDQYGGNWEYIRFHIPTFLGQSLSGNPNAGSDMDGIFSGNPIIATRDYQWKTFTSTMLDMDGWGSYRKTPFAHGDPYTGISRMYLKLKAQLMPYIYTSAASAANIDTGNGDTGLPMMRAMFLTDSSDYALSGAETLNYQFTFGNDLLVAPVYENSKGDGIGEGDDVRNGIYLPNYNQEGEEPTIWIDYFSGKQYRGGQVLENYDAPLWKLPLFVKAGAIIPMYEENNNPQAISKENPDGLDKTKRIVEFWPAGSTEYTLFEDDGEHIENKVTDVEGYGKQADISYGSHISTHISSKVEGDKATLTIDASTGTYEGYDANRRTTMVVNVSKVPTAIKSGGQDLKKVDSKDALDKLADTESGWCYVEEPNLNTGAVDHPEEKEFAKIEMKTTPKVYVKLARTDVSKNAQTVTVEGFENKGVLGADTLNKDLAAPAELTAPEDAKTPTSIVLNWKKVEGAASYEIKVDGTIHALGDQLTFTHKDLPYHSTHTYQVRARNDKGYSEWSGEVKTTSLEDPWRNVPKATATWSGDYYNNQTEAIALDHDLNSSHFHSSSGAVSNGDTLTLDFGLAYKLDALDYYPRSDHGNGTVQKMKVETSLDGNTWTEVETEEWSWKKEDDFKSVSFGDRAARYVRLTATKAVGDFFSAREIKVTKDDGTEGFAVGSTGFKPTITDGDIQNIEQYKGIENRGSDQNTFGSQVADRYCDLNNNGVYDIYDYSFTLSQYNGGTKQEGAVSGSLMFVPDKNAAKAGDTITYTLYASNVKNVYALGALLNFQSADFDYVDGSLKGTSYIGAMKNLSVAKTAFADGKQTINLAFGNLGDMELFDGTAAVASFQLKAKHDMDAAAIARAASSTPYTTYLIGPKCDVIEYTYDGEVTLPEKPESTEQELGRDAFNITITNEALPTDDGSNVTKLIQQKSFDNLFNGTESYVDGKVFEFLWNYEPNFVNGKFPEYVKLPVDIHFALKDPRALDNIEICNRESGSGRVKKLNATVTFEDGSKQEFTAGEQTTYVFEISAENKGKKVKNVDVSPQEANGIQMLTICEINFNYTTAGVTATDVKLGENASELYVGDLTEVKATVLPEDDRYPFYNVAVSDPNVASVTQVQSADGSISWFLRANNPGEATVTVSALANPEAKAEYKLVVKEGVNTSELEDAIAEANRYAERAYTAETYKALKDAVAEAQALLESQDLTADKAHEMVVKIQKAIDGLKMNPLDFDTHFNKDASSGAKAVKANSSAGESPFESALDYNEATFWHSSYSDQDILPDYVIYDLGSEHNLTDVAFKTRQDGGTNGDIFEAQVYVADSVEALDGDGKGTLLGTFKFDNNGKVLDNRDGWQQMSFGATPTRFVKIEAIKAGGDTKNAYAAIAETRFYEAQEIEYVDVTKLQELLNIYNAEGLKTENFTEDTWKPFANLMTDAQAMVDSPLEATEENQAIVDTLAADLKAAREALVEKTPEPEAPSKDQLADLVSKAEDVDTAGKTSAVVAEYKAALANARAVLDDPNATEAQIKDAYMRLNEALAKLEADQGPTDPEPNPGPENPNGNGGSTGGGQNKPNSNDKPNSGLPSTGDPAALAVAGTGLLGSVVAAIGAFFHRKDRG